MSIDASEWEQRYLTTKPEALPWNAGGPDSDLVRLVESGVIKPCQALDIGTGPGHDAVYLIQKGFDVIGLDISPTAVQLARENASNAGLFGFFQVGDVRDMPVEDRYVDFVNDRGCFHTLNDDDRLKALNEIERVMKPRGLFLLRVFSDKEPGNDGPRRYARQELETVFKGRFTIKDFWEGIYEGSRKAATYSLLLQR